MVVSPIFLLMFFTSKKVSQQQRATHKGAVVIVEASANTAQRLNSKRTFNNQVYGYDKLTLRPVIVGHIVALQGNQIRIALSGNWERVNENSIKGIVDFTNDGSGAWVGKTEWVFTVGEAFPIGSRRRKSTTITAVGSESPTLRVLQLYVPEDSLSS